MNTEPDDEPTSEAEQLVLLRQFAVAIRRHADARGATEVVDLIDKLDAVAAEIQDLHAKRSRKPDERS